MYLNTPHSAKVNYKLIITTVVLFFIGLLVQYTTAGGNIKPGVWHQVNIALLSFPILITIVFTPTKTLIKISPYLFVGSILLLFLVMTLGVKIMGATRWLRIGSFNLQPSELIKITLILILGFYFERVGNYTANMIQVWLLPILLISIPSLLIFKQPNLGTSITIILIGVTILFAMEFPKKWAFYLLSVILAATPFIWHTLRPYQKRRVINFFNPTNDPFNSGYNLLQSKIAIGSGGLFGKGFLEGSQTQLEFLPEKHSDFVFTVLSEEGGFITSLIVITLYYILVMESIAVAARSPHRYGKVLAIGSSALFSIHSFINIGMTMGLLPITGIPLPLISYGGSITLTALLAVALVINVDFHLGKETEQLEYLNTSNTRFTSYPLIKKRR